MILKPVSDSKQFSALAQTHIGVFASEKWLSVYGNELTLIGIFKDEQQLIGGFYYLKTKKKNISFIKLPPYTPHCGLFFHSENKNRSSANNFSKELMEEVCTHISGLGSALTILAFPSEIKDMQPFIWNKYKVIPNYTYRIDLTQTMEVIRSHFDPKNRNAINKAIKEGVQVKEKGLGHNELLGFFKTSLTTAGANVYDNELKNIFTQFADDSNSFSFSAFKNGENIGNVFCIYDERVCYYLLGGVDKQAGVQGINNLLMQHCIEKAQQLNCKVFDFEGSMLKGVEKFFRGFGPELIPYYTINKGKLPVELALKFLKREIF